VVRLLINGNPADIETSEKLGARIIRRAPTIEVGATKGDYTLNLNLPATDRNNALLAFTGKYNKAGSYSNQPTLDARIEVDGSTVLRGRLFITGREPDRYKGVIVGDSVSWGHNIRGKSLRDVQAPGIVFTGMRSPTRNPWPENPAGTGVALPEVWAKDETQDEYFFPLISYGNFPAFLDPSIWGADPPDNPLQPGIEVADSKGLRAGALLLNNSHSETHLDFTNFRPCWYVRPLLRRIFEDAGYSVSGQFFDVTDQRAPRNLCVPYTGKDGAEWNWRLLGSYKERHTAGIAYRNVPFVPLGSVSNLGMFYDPLVPTSQGAFAWALMVPNNNYSLSYDYSNGASRFTYLGPDPGNGSRSAHSQWTCLKDGMYTLRYFGRIADATYTTSNPLIPVFPGVTRGVIALRRFDGPSAIGGAGLVTLSDETGITDGGLLANGTTSDTNLLVWDFFNTRQAGASATPITDTISLEYTGTFKKGDAVMPFMFLDADNNQGNNDWRVVIESGQRFEVVQSGLGQTESPELLYPQSFLPDMDQLDYVKALNDLFGLVITADSATRSVSIDYIEDYYLPASQGVDWTDKANIETIVTEPNDMPARLEFNWEIEKDDLIVDPNSQKVSYTYLTSIPTADGKQEIALPFAYTGNRTFTIWDGNNIRGLLLLACIHNKDAIGQTLGELADGSETIEYDYEPRLLVGVPTRSVTLWIEGEQFSVVPICVAETDRLGWYIAPLASNPGGLASGQYASGYSERIQRLERGYKAEVEAMLTPYDLATLDYRRPVLIAGQAYYVIEVDAYNPAEPKPVKVKMIRY